MILTGPEITSASQDGRLRIDPFLPAQVNPNNCNVRLGPVLLTCTEEVLDSHRPNPTRRIQIGDDVVPSPGMRGMPFAFTAVKP
ncbi:dCTP deaminase domain-containing protein [Streptomyces sp. NPDC090741]|uniref:dCTP deaminase domain-containing protein n=1 Tax=Streptomyces sp. NPDC090741 TaxID=3365967 RepID=UPI0038104F78